MSYTLSYGSTGPLVRNLQLAIVYSVYIFSPRRHSSSCVLLGEQGQRSRTCFQLRTLWPCVLFAHLVQYSDTLRPIFSLQYRVFLLLYTYMHAHGPHSRYRSYSSPSPRFSRFPVYTFHSRIYCRPKTVCTLPKIQAPTFSCTLIGADLIPRSSPSYCCTHLHNNLQSSTELRLSYKYLHIYFLFSSSFHFSQR